MPKVAKRLSPITVARLKTPGLFADGGGLYLRVTKGNSKYWVFRFSFDGKRREMFIGKFPDMSLAEAIKEAAGCREKVKQGEDPIEARKAKEERNAAQRLKDKAKNHVLQGLRTGILGRSQRLMAQRQASAAMGKYFVAVRLPRVR